MQIDWNHFTPWLSLGGGLLLGVAAAIFILLNGRVLGISGIVGGLLRPRTGDIAWRASFLLGLLTAPSLYAAVAVPLQPRIDASWTMVILAGLLVGIGTRVGSGCTSGHGLSGMAQLSVGSTVAVAAMFAGGIATASLLLRRI